MATIIDNSSPDPTRAVLVERSDNSAGWVVAIIILVAIIVGGAFWYMHYYHGAAHTAPASTVQVNLPAAGYAPTGNTTAPATTPAAPNSNPASAAQ